MYLLLKWPFSGSDVLKIFLSEKLTLLTQNKDKLCKILIITFPQKIVIITFTTETEKLDECILMSLIRLRSLETVINLLYERVYKRDFLAVLNFVVFN
jgi:hypothetical protein